MEKQEFLEEVNSAWKEWSLVLSEIRESRMVQPGAIGDWSVKDLVAHISWYEREMVGLLKSRSLGGSDLWNLPDNERNAAILEQNRYRPLREILAESQDIHRDMVVEIQQLSNEDLNDPGHFADMPSDWIPWDLIAGNTYVHYRDHIQDLRNWLNQEDESSQPVG